MVWASFLASEQFRAYNLDECKNRTAGNKLPSIMQRLKVETLLCFKFKTLLCYCCVSNSNYSGLTRYMSPKCLIRLFNNNISYAKTERSIWIPKKKHQIHQRTGFVGTLLSTSVFIFALDLGFESHLAHTVTRRSAPRCVCGEVRSHSCCPSVLDRLNP